MTKPRNTLLLIGSPKTKRSTSRVLGESLLARIAGEGFTTRTLCARLALSAEGEQTLLEAVERADLLLISFPLYVDSLPAPLIRAFELIARHRQDRQSPPIPLAVIANCGFPEARQNRTALAICHRFALQANFVWAGGLALGAGGAIDGRPLEQRKGMTGNITRSLDLAAMALLRGEAIPPVAVELMARPLMPAWLYRQIGNLGWIIQARKNGVLGRLRARPYAPTQGT